MSATAAAPRRPSRPVLWLMRLLALAALGVSVYLTAASWGSSPLAGCGPGSGCASVLASPWSRWFLLPVSAAATGLYLAVLGGLSCIGPAAPPALRRAAWTALLGAGVLVVLAAAWFTALQMLVIHRYCPWCMTAHALGSLLAVLLWVSAPVAWRKPPPPPPLPAGQPAPPTASPALGATLGRTAALAAVLLGGLLSLALVLGQTLVQPRTYRVVEFGSIKINTAPCPILGRADAPHTVVFFADFTCPHCRMVMHYLHEAERRWPGRIAVALALAPLDAECNPMYAETDEIHQHGCEYARLALAVWMRRREEFGAFYGWLETGERPPPIEEVRRRAAAILGVASAAEAQTDPRIKELLDAQIQANALLRQRARERGYAVGDGVPTLVMGPGQLMAGQPGRQEEFLKVLAESLGLPWADAAANPPAAPPSHAAPAPE